MADLLSIAAVGSSAAEVERGPRAVQDPDWIGDEAPG
jgi:hypothetical protein